jgi:hypothetical protein
MLAPGLSEIARVQHAIFDPEDDVVRQLLQFPMKPTGKWSSEPDARDGAAPVDCVRRGRAQLLEVRAHRIDRLFEVIQVAEDLVDQEGVVGAEAAGQGLAECGQLLPQPPARPER